MLLGISIHAYIWFHLGGWQRRVEREFVPTQVLGAPSPTISALASRIRPRHCLSVAFVLLVICSEFSCRFPVLQSTNHFVLVKPLSFSMKDFRGNPRVRTGHVLVGESLSCLPSPSCRRERISSRKRSRGAGKTQYCRFDLKYRRS